jgi:aspartyl-tRNA(Asn)/glutamyl-tRNA(Gln) amidotransferase subunit C
MNAPLISKETVAKVAKLARISDNPSDEFLEKYSQELSPIIGYIDQLQEADTDGVLPTDGVRTISVEGLRADEPSSDKAQSLDIRNRIIANFPNKQGDLLVLPGIFEEN